MNDKLSAKILCRGALKNVQSIIAEARKTTDTRCSPGEVQGAYAEGALSLWGHPPPRLHSPTRARKP